MSEQTHTHVDELGNLYEHCHFHHDVDDFTDYNEAVNAYRKTFPNKQRVIGALKKNSVNIAVHGHMPTLVREIVRLGQSEEYIEKAKAVGADGIQFYGICCTGLSAMYRYNNVIPLCNPPGAELVLSTGTLDLWVADVQDIYPSIMNAANCFRTVVVTTNDSTKLPGAVHLAYDHTHSNIGQTTELARKIVERAIESYQARKGIPKFMLGMNSYHCVEPQTFGSENVTRFLKEDTAMMGLGIMVVYTNPQALGERMVADLEKKRKRLGWD